MILGYSSNAFTRFSLVEAARKIGALGFGGIEIMCDRPHLYPPDARDADLVAIREALDTHGLKITNLNCFTLFAIGDTYLPSWIEPDPARREMRIHHTLACIDLAHRLGCGRISIPPGGPLPPSLSRQQAFSLFYAGLEKVIPAAEDKGVHLLVEPEPDLLIERTAEFTAFIRDVQSAAVRLNFDIGHFFCVGENPSRSFETLFEWIDHIHLEDIAADRVHHHLIPGRGAIPFLELFQRIAASSYPGDICLELYTCVEDPESAGRESLNHLLPLFHEAGLRIG